MIVRVVVAVLLSALALAGCTSTSPGGDHALSRLAGERQGENGNRPLARCVGAQPAQ